jgi:hypothetical protein
MKHLNTIYKLLALSIVFFNIENTNGTEGTTEDTKAKEEVAKTTSGKSQPTQPVPPLKEPLKEKDKDTVEPYGLESGKIVDKPADLADKIGNKINKMLGNDD